MASGKEIQLYGDIGKSQPVYPTTNAKCVYYDNGTRLDRMIAYVAGSKNLLINSDFTKPVNRKGLTSLVANGSAYQYFLDRWLHVDFSGSSVTFTLTDEGVAVANGTGYFYQRYEKGWLKENADYTLAVYYADGTHDVRQKSYPLLVLSFTNEQYDQLFFTVDAGKTVSKVALYEGEYTIDTLPRYRPKGYEQELLICNQYDTNTGEYIGLRKFGYAYNLLDNSNFKNPVNELGHVSGATVKGYFIDKWQTSGQTPVTLSADGLSFTYYDVSQMMPADAIEANGECTLACKVGGKILCYPGRKGKGLGVWGDGIAASYESSTDRYKVVLTKTNTVYEWVAFYKGAYTLDTLPEYQPKGKQVEALNCGAIPGPIDLLWENASPTSEFAAQTVAVDLSLYSWCAIETYHSTTEVASTVDFMPVKEGVQYAVDVVDSSDNTARRPFTISKTGIVFDGAKRSGSNTTKYVIPVRIYGVKG